MSAVNNLPLADQSLLLIPQNYEQTKFDGYVIIKNEEYRVKIALVSPDVLEGARFQCEWKVKELLRGYEAVLQKRLQQSSTLASFLEEFKALVENLLLFREDSPPSISFISSVIKEVSTIGWKKLVHTNQDFTIIKLRQSDGRNRDHVITIKHHSSKFTCIADLPVPFSPRYTQQEGAVKLIYEQFTQVIQSFQAFWDILDEIDKSCWILEPENVTFACTYRRIAIGKNSSIYIQLNPLRPFEFPAYRMLGADHVIEPLKQKLNCNIDSWDEKESVLGNLQRLLEYIFPAPDLVSKEEINVTCGICYSYRLMNEIPECTCDDPRCGQTYHSSCLMEWLRSVPTCRQSFNVIFGECPYCNKSLTVRVNKTG